MQRRLPMLGRCVSVALAAGFVLLAGACGSSATEESESGGAGASESLTPVTLILNGPAAGSSAGFMYAKELGLYSKAGLDVTIRESGGSAVAAETLAAGKATFALADGPTVMVTASKGAPLKLVAIIHENNGYAIISLEKSNITSISGLAGKTLGIQPGTAQTALLTPILKANGLSESDVRLQNVDASALQAALLSGKVDAILGAAVYNSVLLREQGAEVHDILFSDVGVPTFGLSIATTEKEIQDRPEIVKKFVAASIEGWDELRTHVTEAAQAVADQFPAAGSVDDFTDQVEAITKVSLCGPGSPTIGWPASSEVTQTFDLMTKYQGLPSSPPVTSYYTRRFLPETLPACGKE